jgi:hypothetical protein
MPWRSGGGNNTKAGLTTEHTDNTEKGRHFLYYNPVELETGVMAEVYQQANAMVTETEIVLELCPVFGSQLAGGFEFEDYLFVTNQIRLVLMLKRSAFVCHAECWLGNERNAARLKFDFQALLIYCLQKAAARMGVHIQTRPYHRISLFLIKQQCLLSFRAVVKSARTRIGVFLRVFSVIRG